VSSLPLPRLLHKTLVKIRQQNQSGTKYDRRAREPVGKVARRVPIYPYAQVSWKSAVIKTTAEGNEVTVDGYLLFLRTDLVKLGIDIQYSDLIYEIGTGPALRSVNLFVEMIQYRGHNPNYGGHTLVKAWFTDKSPTRHS